MHPAPPPSAVDVDGAPEEILRCRREFGHAETELRNPAAEENRPSGFQEDSDGTGSEVMKG